MSKPGAPARLTLAVALCCSVFLAAACRRQPPPPATETSARPSGLAREAVPPPRAFSAPEAAASGSPAAPATAACRAMRVTGSARTASGEPLATQDPLDGRTWLSLDEHSELVVRHGPSARELSLHGPGRFLPCRAGLEQVLVAEGTLQSSRGTGVRPGAEVWVATPFGAVRYADAELKLTVERGGARLHVRAGQAFTEAFDGPDDNGEGVLVGPAGSASARGNVDAARRVSSCERAAQAALASAKQVMAAKPTELGEFAATQLRSRRLARGRCLVAEAAAARVENLATKARLAEQLQRSETTWQGIPKSGETGPLPSR